MNVICATPNRFDNKTDDISPNGKTINIIQMFLYLIISRPQDHNIIDSTQPHRHTSIFHKYNNNIRRLTNGKNVRREYFEVLTLLSAKGGSHSGWPKSIMRCSSPPTFLSLRFSPMISLYYYFSVYLYFSMTICLPPRLRLKLCQAELCRRVM